MSDKCISCHEPLSYPSGDGCTNMTAHAKEPTMSNTRKSIEVQVVNATENEEGSATYTFDVSQGANT